MELYRQAQDEVDRTLASVEHWETPSTCPGWTVRDVAGHLIWGQRQLRAWATGEPDPARDGAPGAPHPAVLTGDDPAATWRAARSEAGAGVTPGAMGRVCALPGM